MLNTGFVRSKGGQKFRRFSSNNWSQNMRRARQQLRQGAVKPGVFAYRRVLPRLPMSLRLFLHPFLLCGALYSRYLL